MVSIAFAGAGWVTAIHALAADAIADLWVTRVASGDDASARQRAAQTGAAICAYDELPAGADAVLVATPPAWHEREAQRAADTGVVALIETPIADTLAAADRLVAATGSGARFAYGENLVHSPAIVEAVRACRRIGGLNYLEVRFAQGVPDWGHHTEPSWGGGTLFELGPHAVAVALLCAAPARAVEVGAQLDAGAGMDVDDHAEVELTFDSGLRATIEVSWRASAASWHAQAANPTGAVRFELLPEPSVDLNGVARSLPPPPPGVPSPQLHHLGYVGQLATLAADAARGRAPRCCAAFGRTVLEVICAAYASAGHGGQESLPFTGRRDCTPYALWRGGSDDPGRSDRRR